MLHLLSAVRLADLFRCLWHHVEAPRNLWSLLHERIQIFIEEVGALKFRDTESNSESPAEHCFLWYGGCRCSNLRWKVQGNSPPAYLISGWRHFQELFAHNLRPLLFDNLLAKRVVLAAKHRCINFAAINQFDSVAENALLAPKSKQQMSDPPNESLRIMYVIIYCIRTGNII